MLITYILLAVAFFIGTLAVIVRCQTVRGQPGRNFAWFLISFSAWIATGALLLSPTITRTEALWTTRAAFFCDTAWGIGWLWFTAFFPITASARYRTFVLAWSLLGIPWFALCWHPAFVTAVTQRPWATHVQMGAISKYFTYWIAACIFVGFIHLLLKRRGIRGLERLQTQYVAYGMTVWFVIGVTCNLLLPQITGKSDYVHIGLLTTIIPASAITYAIVRHRLMGLKFILRHAVLFTLCAGIFIGAFNVLISLTRPSGTPSLAQEQIAFFTILGIACAIYPLFHALQFLVDRYFFRIVANYRQAVRDYSEKFAMARDPRIITELFSTAIRHTLCPQQITLLLPRGDHFVPLIATSTTPITLPTAHILLRHAQSTDEVMPVGEYLRGDDHHHALARQMQEWGIEVAVPFVAGGCLRGLALLGDKQFGDPYSLEDYDLLRTLAKEASITLDNAAHYQELVLLNSELEQRVQERTETLATTLAALDMKHAYLMTALDLLPIPLYFATAGPEMPTIERHNKALLELLQAGDTALLRDAITLLHPNTHRPLEPRHWPDTRALNGETVTFQELELQGSNDVRLPIIVSAAPIYLAQQVVAAAVIIQDISILKAADRAKDDFLAKLSHELISPLTAIIGWGEMARQYPACEEITQALEIIERNACRQQHLVNDLLDVSRIIHGKLHMQQEIVDLWHQARQNADNLAPVFRERQINLVLEAPAEPLPIYADPTRIQQVLVNVLNNALKFTPPGGTITLAAARDGDEALFRVTDTGQGIEPDALQRIFHPFQQAKNTVSTPGLGLGLALVKGLVEVHGGQVSAESAGIGHGSTFIIRFPLATERQETCV